MSHQFQRQIDTIVIHCSDSPNGRNDHAADIDLWHRQRGWHRQDFFRIKKGFNSGLTSIGYHFVININGQIETGRHPDEIGAHVAGHNSKSIGICMIGTDRFTPEQWSALDKLVQDLRYEISISANPVKADHVIIVGHYQFPDAHKTCPNFDVPAWLKTGRIPIPRNVYLTD